MASQVEPTPLGTSFLAASTVTAKRKKNEGKPISQTKGSTVSRAKTAITTGVKRLDPESCTYGVELGATVIFLVMLLVLILVSTLLVGNDEIPGNLQRLQLDSPVGGTVEFGNSVFFDISVTGGDTFIVFIKQADSTLDTTLSLKKRPNDLLSFNDDIASENLNSLLVFTEEQDQDLVIEVGSFQAESQGDFTIEFKKVDIPINIDEEFSTTIDAFQFFVAKSTLSAGVTYHIYAFDVVEVDAALRIRRRNGDEVIEAFQSTISEFTPRVIMTPDETDEYIIEVRGINQTFTRDIDVTVLIFEADKDIFALPTVGQNPITRQNIPVNKVVSTVFEMDFQAHVTYKFDFGIDIAPNQPDKNTFGPLSIPIEDDKRIIAATRNILEALSVRVIQKNTNEVLIRARTDMTSSIDISLDQTFANDLDDDLNDDDFYVEMIITFGPTSFKFTAKQDITVLMDISRMNPDYASVGADSQIGTFDLTVTNEGLLSLEQIEFVDSLVDENDLFVTCDVDQTKHSTNDGCENGIVLFCRNEFFPFLLTENATLEEFEDICDCVDFLCATLPSGEDLNKGVETFLKFCFGLFAAISLLGILIYVMTTIDICLYGGFGGWIYRGFGTWTICGIFFVFSAIFFITQIQLSDEIKIMQKIGEEFDLEQIISPSDFLDYSYYDIIAYAVVDREPAQEILVHDADDPFLNDNALEAIPKDLTFDKLRKKVIVNQVAFVFFQALSVICFLDISVVWIESSRATTLNRLHRKRQFARFKIAVRCVEAFYFLLLVVYSGLFASTNGQSYSVTNSVFVFLLSFGLVVLYLIGRQRLMTVLVISKLRGTDEQHNGGYWRVVRRVSTIVILANIGVIIVQVYSMINIQSFEDLVGSNNDPVAIAMLLFQDFCIFSGQIAIFGYLYDAYRGYKASLIDEHSEVGEEEKPSKNNQTSQQETREASSFSEMLARENNANNSTEMGNTSQVEENISQIL